MNNELGFLTLLSRLPEDVGSITEVSLGEAQVTASQSLYTVIGASVVVCLIDIKSGQVGMGHVILPSQFSHHRDDAMLRSDSAMEALYNRMCEAIRASGTIPQLKAKLFGGADIKRDGASVSDGKQSVAFSRNWLRTRNIPILNESVGGAKRREVILLSGSGTVYCKQVSMNSEFLERERNALLPVSTPLNHVELF